MAIRVCQHFRPQHLAAAVAAGKHVFAEKPLAVDGPGIRSVLATAQEAERKKLSVVVGFQGNPAGVSSWTRGFSFGSQRGVSSPYSRSSVMATVTICEVVELGAMVT